MIQKCISTLFRHCHCNDIVIADKEAFNSNSNLRWGSMATPLIDDTYSYNNIFVTFAVLYLFKLQNVFVQIT